MQLIALLAGIIILLVLIIKFKINTFVSLVLTAAITAIFLGMPLGKIADSITNGIGSQLGELSMVFGFGAMLGRLVSDSGGAYMIASTLIKRFGKQRLQIAVMIASFILGIALFFEVGMVLLVPIVFAIAVEAGVPILYLGIPMAAALSVTHGFLPPHPAPVAIAQVLGANDGRVLLFGFIIAIIAAYIAGPLFSKLARKFAPDAFNRKGNLSSIGEVKEFSPEESPSFGLSVLTALFPVILLAIATIYKMTVNGGAEPKNPSLLDSIIEFIGSPSIAMLISLFFAMWTMGWARKRTTAQIMESLENAVKSIAMLLLVIGGGGAFKQVLIDGGVGKEVAKIFLGSSISPLILGWLIAVVLRIALGSATVASLTAAGIVAPLMAQSGVDPALMVLAIGAGSLAASHVNDAGFWMFREYFDLTIKQTLETWTVLESIISVVGIVLVMIMNLFFH
ncbi:MAG: gluconate:H+ symporter [Lentilactobacillus hilgardii]|jgi:GntP family gluconate:H+ symporter|uniref:Transporter, gluconate:H+ symporter family n=4 Tax=Lentilactobacillus hilgardii TaxID=1588 RepID=C0XHR2_LENH9|nr:gluconate:H+ symporter [Lentilactobacillus hilgardii]EEI19248.1 transporter, gluconate:H+ symporter family [Lentilactobacillus buchneri ATCC 11577]MCI1923486.1 gluconate:H+ symporter [Lentilactobacillus buchneri]RRG10246.1 MAG: gluconate permease [Lactobacillus sp.]EEI25194.1 transporter, gluconate:H+ symporter family [Lentilactobacillus hilgardii DSM 20176 = ATCC 8290]EEI70674.1 transporter, gluconate:H+ symporter family [Lentilactobacillus hilgardii ATCC 27305]